MTCACLSKDADAADNPVRGTPLDMDSLVVTTGLKDFLGATLRDSFGDLSLAPGPAGHYLVDLLVRFAVTEELRPRAHDGGRLDSYAECALAIERAWDLESDAFDPAEEVRLRHHFADYALFMTGFFWDRVRRESMLRHYIGQGRRGYRLVAEYERARGGEHADVFRALAGGFETYAGVLTYMREVYLGADFAPGVRQLFVRLAGGF
jgi:hypothetical protein